MLGIKLNQAESQRSYSRLNECVESNRVKRRTALCLLSARFRRLFAPFCVTVFVWSRTSQVINSGGSRGEARGPPKKFFLRPPPPPLLRVWVTPPPPLSEGVDPPLINMYFFYQLVWCRTGFTNSIKVKVKEIKMLKVGGKRKRKERKKEKNHTNSIARIRACASPPAVSFACLKLHHAAKGKKYQICSISEYHVTINHTPYRLKKKHSSCCFKCK